MKQCRSCEQTLALESFPVNARYKDGRDIRCKACCAAITRAWRERNPDSARAAERRWKEKNPERVKAAAKRRHERLLERKPGIQSEYVRRYREKFPEKIKAYAEKWAKENPELCAKKSAERRAATLRAVPAWLQSEHRQQIADAYKKAKRVSRETGVKHHVDHIVPLKGKDVCGLHVPWNLQVIPATVNQRKWIKVEEAA